MLILRLCSYLLQKAGQENDDNEDLTKTAQWAQSNLQSMA
jgi:hypothetical protein